MNVKGMKRSEQFELFLILAGYFEGRKIDVTKYEEEAKRRKILMSSQMQLFFQAYGELDEEIIFSYEEMSSDIFYPFMIRTALHSSNDLYFSLDFLAIKAHVKEPVMCVGLFGYYYPGVLAIGASGTLYIKHDYVEEVSAFDDILKLIEWELKTCPTICEIKIGKSDSSVW